LGDRGRSVASPVIRSPASSRPPHWRPHVRHRPSGTPCDRDRHRCRADARPGRAASAAVV